MRRTPRPKVKAVCPICEKVEYVYAGRGDSYVACSREHRRELTMRKHAATPVGKDVWDKVLGAPWLPKKG